MSGYADLTADILHIAAIQGDTVDIDFNFFSDDAETVPIDISTFDPKVQIRNNGELVLTLTDGTGLSIEAPNILHLIIDNSENVRETQDYDYDIQFTESNGNIRTWVKGQLTIEEQETQ